MPTIEELVNKLPRAQFEVLEAQSGQLPFDIDAWLEDVRLDAEETRLAIEELGKAIGELNYMIIEDHADLDEDDWQDWADYLFEKREAEQMVQGRSWTNMQTAAAFHWLVWEELNQYVARAVELYPKRYLIRWLKGACVRKMSKANIAIVDWSQVADALFIAYLGGLEIADRWYREWR